MKRWIISALSIILLAVLCFTPAAHARNSLVSYPEWMVYFTSSDSGNVFGVDSYKGADSDITVPDRLDGVRVIEIGDHAFSGSELHSVTMGAYIVSIGEYAFLNCAQLEQLTLDPALSSIADSAFSGTTALKSINLQDTAISNVGKYAFMDSGIEQIALPDTCAMIGECAFLRCGSLAKLTIPDSVTEIAENAFEGCDSFMIYCTTDSYAHTYAEEKGISYVLTDAPVEVTYMVGDADGDGVITILDATKIQRLLAVLITDEDGMIALRSDCDGDGLNILDATKIQRYLVGFITDAQIGELTMREITPES